MVIVLARVRREPIGSLDAMRLYVFTELGRGCVEDIQQAIEYAAWLTQEQVITS